MGRRRVLKSLEDYVRALQNGKGLGVGASYQPWLRVNDVSSNGKSVKIYGIKTDRTYQLISGIEEHFYYYAEFNPRVIDIREQFPLFPVDLVACVAREAGLDYPTIKNPKTPVSCQLTSCLH